MRNDRRHGGRGWLLTLALWTAPALAVEPSSEVGDPRASEGPVVSRAEGGSSGAGPFLGDDPALRSVIEEVLVNLPDVSSADAGVRAEAVAAAVAGRLPEPMIEVGLEEGTFASLEMARASVMLSQVLPAPGVLARSQEASLARVDAVGAARDRVVLSAVAETERAWLDLLFVRARLDLQARLDVLWAQAEDLALAAYESQRASQSELLRAQLERARLDQRRIALEAEERTVLARLARLRGSAGGPLPEPGAPLHALAIPIVPTLEEALDDAYGRSPELALALAAGTEAESRLGLARAQRWPDLTVKAGVMPYLSGASPMWQVGLGIELPVTGVRRAAVAEASARSEAWGSEVDAVRLLLAQRVEERVTALDAYVATLRVYRGGLLIRSDAAVESTLAAYRTGEVDLTALLGTLAGRLADEEGFLGSLAGAWAAQVALDEASLDPVALPAAAGSGTPATRSMSAGAARSTATASPPASASSPSSGMGGM